MPYIIRYVEDRNFLLVGEAYIHGIMDGAMTEKDSKIVDIELC